MTLRSGVFFQSAVEAAHVDYLGEVATELAGGGRRGDGIGEDQAAAGTEGAGGGLEEVVD